MLTLACNIAMPFGTYAGVKQNFARKHHIPIDTITFNYRCLPEGGDYSKVRALVLCLIMTETKLLTTDVQPTRSSS